MTISNLVRLKKKLQQKRVDFLILNNSDQFFLEYIPNCEKRIEFLTGFSGSNAVLLLSSEQKLSQNSKFFTDSRYLIQAKQQIDNKIFEIIDMAEQSLFSWLENNIKKQQKIAILAKLFSLNSYQKLQKLAKEKQFEIICLDNEFVDDLWFEQEKQSNSKIFHHKIEFSGEESTKKLLNITKNLKNDAYFLANSESICWLLNIRASDVEYSPLLACYAIIYKNNEIDIFIDKKRLEEDCFSGFEIKFFDKISELNNHQKNNQDKLRINVINPDLFQERIKHLQQNIKSIGIDENSTNFWVYNLLKQAKINIINEKNPILLNKAIKNKVEIKNMIKAHEIDGLALTKFLFWLEKATENNEIIDELICEEKILEFRKKNHDFYYPSFRSISSFAENGAIVHYASSQKTNKKFDKNSLYLLDSGGQYNQGTTDVTRTVAINQPNAEMKHNFTLVLKGHIALATSEFDEKTTGDQLDFLARQFLLKENKNYGHSTGHGVGSFLSVHEGPVSIGPKSKLSTFKAGMILSNEPGFYLENKYGIRIENLVLVKKQQDKFFFETLTLAPININLIETNILTDSEKNWLKNYHKKIYDALKPDLTSEESLWLEKIYSFYKNI